MPDTDHRPLPTRVAPPGAPLGSWGLLRAVLRNPLEAVPAAAYEEPLARQALFGRERVFVSDPELVERVLVGEADAFVKGEVTRRALGPALGEAILTAEGERWRWQRRAVAPIFRHERVLGFLPAMLAAAERRRDQWLALPPGSSVELGREMMRTTFEVIVETMLSGSGGEGDHRGALDVGRIERNITEYLRSTGWAILLALLKAPRWTPHPGRARAARARDHLRGELLRLVAERRAAAASTTAGVHVSAPMGASVGASGRDARAAGAGGATLTSAGRPPVRADASRPGARAGAEPRAP